MIKPINVLSLADGISCGLEALRRAGIPIANYYASEIDKHAIAISRYRHPGIIRLGDMTKWRSWNLPKIDLVIGGLPCQPFSLIGNKEGVNDPRGQLIYIARQIVDHYNPKHFLFENVRMSKANKKIFDDLFGVEGFFINSKLVSAQSRPRWYWANFEITEPADRGVELDNILFDDALAAGLKEQRTEEAKKIRSANLKMGKDWSPFRGKEIVPRRDGKSACVTATHSRDHYLLILEDLLHSDKALAYMNSPTGKRPDRWAFAQHSDVRKLKSAAVVANWFKGVPSNVLISWNCVRKIHPIEAERLQTLPDNYTLFGMYDKGVKEVAFGNRWKAIGNGWTIEVLSHIFQGLLKGID